MKNNNKEENDELRWLHHVRYVELEMIKEFLLIHKNSKILEIGGGDGFQAKILSNEGFSVVSVDIEPRSPQVFPVQKIDNNKLNFSNETFDIIFTSHVLPHIQNIEDIFDEIKRVIKKDGIIIHVVPTSGWSLITNILHYIFIPKFLIKSIKKKISNKLNCQINSKQKIQKEKSNQTILKKLFLHPLGQNKSFIHEIVFFSYKNWKKIFFNSGFEITNVKRGPYITSGYGVFKFKLILIRKKFSKYFFSSSYCFVLKL
jgi:ubiquinone/menaquinone biosynthesis C-methylase UbiE